MYILSYFHIFFHIKKNVAKIILLPVLMFTHTKNGGPMTQVLSRLTVLQRENDTSHETVTDWFIVKNDRGLHTRPATEIVKCAAKFQCEIEFTYQRTVINAKSILGILILTAGRGARIKVAARGPDAKEAVQTLLTLAKNQFNIKY